MPAYDDHIEDTEEARGDAVAEREARLDAALSRGALEKLPPNQPMGLLGERGPKLLSVDEFKPSLNAGLSQENDGGVWWLAIVLAVLIVGPILYALFTR